MNGVVSFESSDHSEFVEVDPTGRYGRYNEILGKGASKIVYRAFDEYEGIEVAWNQVKFCNFLRSPEDLERLYHEIHLLKTLKHKNIMKFHTSWVDTENRNVNFVTEMFTSGTLRQYRLKHRSVNIRAVKHWCRQILEGLVYLHSHDPPIIHRDLKCDNIFVNGNQGEIKIGDLGLAAILRKSHAARCVGTPEFMAPEVYEEEYNELIDIYSFGMCILEMLTFDYPYSECTHPAQIYKKVISGKKPDALFKVQDPEVRRFVEKCLATVSQRLSAMELLNDPFLKIDGYVSDLRPIDYGREFRGMATVLWQPLLEQHHNNSSLVNSYSNYLGYDQDIDLDYHHVEYEANEIDPFPSQDYGHLENVDIAIKGARREDDGIFLRLRIPDKEGRVRNIYFPFDIQSDTALSVATEMVAELDITDRDVTKIADMINGEIASLVPEWKRGFGAEESPNDINSGYCYNCSSSGSFVDYLTSEGPGAKTLQVLHCSRHGCGAIHGRFEEITYQFDGSDQSVTDGVPLASSQSVNRHYKDIRGQRDGPELSSQYSTENHELSSQYSTENHSGDEQETSEHSMVGDDGKTEMINRRASFGLISATQAAAEDYENEIRRELRWLKAKYQLQLSELRDQQLGAASISHSPESDSIDQKLEKLASDSISPKAKDEQLLKSFCSGKHFTTYFPVEIAKKCTDLKIPKYEVAYGSCSPEHMVTAKSFYTRTFLPHSLHRATSLPVDATDF